MKVGQLRHLITIETPVAVRNAYGENIPAWQELATVWASIKTLTGRQLALAQANTITSTATHEVRIRADVTDNCRLRFGSISLMQLTTEQFAALTTAQFGALVTDSITPRYFHINLINDVEERGNELVISCTEVTA